MLFDSWVVVIPFYLQKIRASSLFTSLPIKRKVLSNQTHLMKLGTCHMGKSILLLCALYNLRHVIVIKKGKTYCVM